MEHTSALVECQTPRVARCFSEVPAKQMPQGHLSARAREANEPNPQNKSKPFGELEERSSQRVD